MTTSIALVRSDMNHAITLNAPPSPIPEEPAVKTDHVVSYWDPWHDLGLYDPIQNMMPCMGRIASKNGAPCQSEAPIEKSADLKAILVRLASKMPQDVGDEDLAQLLQMGTCNAHQTDDGDDKSLGLKALQYRLNIARMHYERLDRFVDEIRMLRVHIQQIQSSSAPGEKGVGTIQHDVIVNQLRVRIDRLEQENVLARMDTERVEAEGIDREAKLDRDVQARDERIEDLNEELTSVKEQHDSEKSRLTQRLQAAEQTVARLEEQQESRTNEVRQLQSELENHKRLSWRSKIRKWLRRKEP